MPEPPGPALAIGSLAFDEQLGVFRWPTDAVDGPFQLVLLAEDYRPIATVDGIEASPWKPTDALLVSLEPTVVYHAHVRAVVNDRTVKSPMVRFSWH